MTRSSCEVRIRHRSGQLDLDVELHMTDPWSVLFAPSGAGKTTILRMIAGLDRPASGSIVRVVGGNSGRNVLLDTDRNIFVEPHRRNIRMVAQRPALFPHLTVLQNVMYGRSRQELTTKDQWIPEIQELCRIDHVIGKMPSQLSGGERQRVALARAIAAGGDMLLLDEPFTGLEASLRDDLIRDLKLWLDERSIPVLMVTHDIGEVFAAQPVVFKMDSGRIVASGPAHEVLAQERDRLVSRLSTHAGAPSSVQSHRT